MGLLMFGFVAYQLWGTGLQESRAQKQASSEFEELVDDFSDIVDAEGDGAIDQETLDELIADALDSDGESDSPSAAGETAAGASS